MDDDKLTILWEEREIRGVLIALARCVDTFDFEGLAELYAEDGELRHARGGHRGRAGLAEYVREDLGGYLAMHHVSAGHEIEIHASKDSATARMTLLATHVHDEAGRDFRAVGGHYDIELIREQGFWRLKTVTIVPAWTFTSVP